MGRFTGQAPAPSACPKNDIPFTAGSARGLWRTALFDGLPYSLGLVALLGSGLLPGLSEAAPFAFMLRPLFFLGGIIAGFVVLLAPMRAQWLSGVTRSVERYAGGAVAASVQATGTDWPTVQVARPPSGRTAPDAGAVRDPRALHWDARFKVLLGQDRGLGRSVWIWLRSPEDPLLSAARREVSRPTRLRWLACGRYGDWQWDAFMAFTGSPLSQLIGARGQPWPRILPLLEELADELLIAGADGTLPDRLQPDQVWVGPDGQMQLLDLSLGEQSPLAEEIVGDDRASRLLAAVAALSLEGRPRPPGPTRPVRAPLPLHARPALDRLMGGGASYGGVPEFQADLKAVADRPAEVARGRRTTHLVMLTTLLGAGLIFMLSAGWFIRLTSFVGSWIIQEKEYRLRDLEQASLLDFNVSFLNPQPLNRLRALVQLDADSRLRDELKQSIAYDRRQYRVRIESAGWLVRPLLGALEEEAFGPRWDLIERDPINESKHARRHAARTVGKLSVSQMMDRVTLFWLMVLAFWPTLWIVWAFLARGGLSYRLAGIALVRRDGRLASRLQCAWRAILVWAPVTGLLALSLFLEAHYWSVWQAGEPPRWLIPLSSALWYKAVLLLAIYVALVFWRPARALHDRLSGVYLVPR